MRARRSLLDRVRFGLPLGRPCPRGFEGQRARRIHPCKRQGGHRSVSGPMPHRGDHSGARELSCTGCGHANRGRRAKRQENPRLSLRSRRQGYGDHTKAGHFRLRTPLFPNHGAEASPRPLFRKIGRRSHLHHGRFPRSTEKGANLSSRRPYNTLPLSQSGIPDISCSEMFFSGKAKIGRRHGTAGASVS